MIHVNTSEQLVDRCYEGGGHFSLTFLLLEMKVLYIFLSRQHATKYPMPYNHPHQTRHPNECHDTKCALCTRTLWCMKYDDVWKWEAKQASPRIHDFTGNSCMDTRFLDIVEPLFINPLSINNPFALMKISGPKSGPSQMLEPLSFNNPSYYIKIYGPKAISEEGFYCTFMTISLGWPIPSQHPSTKRS